jgi:hypothetical protein
VKSVAIDSDERQVLATVPHLPLLISIKYLYAMQETPNYERSAKNKTKRKQKNSVACGPQANYTDEATATCWRNLMPTFADRIPSIQK